MNSLQEIAALITKELQGNQRFKEAGVTTYIQTTNIYRIREQHLELLDTSDVGHIVGDSASVLTVSKTDVSRLTPSLRPGVTHLPVSSISVDSDNLHSMVDVMSAVREDTTSVSGPGGGIDGNRHGASGLHVRGHVSLRLESLVASKSKDKLGGLGRAGSLLTGGTRGVGVGLLSLDTSVTLDVVVGTLLKTTVASHRSLVALNKLLGGKGVGDSELSHGLGLDLLGSSERPAGSAVSLVLDGGGVDTGPVNKGFLSRVVRDLGSGGVGALSTGDGNVGQVSGLELISGEISELGDAVLGRATLGLIGGIALTDLAHSVHEVLEAGDLLRLVVLLGEVSLELVEHHLDVLHRSVLHIGRGSGGDSGQKNGLVKHLRVRVCVNELIK